MRSIVNKMWPVIKDKYPKQSSVNSHIKFAEGLTQFTGQSLSTNSSSVGIGKKYLESTGGLYSKDRLLSLER